MCGICGEIRFDQKEIEKNSIDIMMQNISRRGPDNKGVFLDKNIFLGHHRLSIIDVSNKSNQPFYDSKLKLTIVFNGVIYNYKKLKSILIQKGYTFSSDGDTEVIIKAYDFFGEKCVNQLDGIFSFCIYDHNTMSFFLARDKLGIKPLYYYYDKDCLRFSSSTKALIKLSSKENQIDIKSLHYQLTLHSVVPSPNTIIKGIKKLPPGNSIIFNLKGMIKQNCYYSFNDNLIDEKISEYEIQDEIERLLCLSIEKRLTISDVPVGILLSGGIDSSLIVAIAAKHFNVDINTFSIGFSSIEQEIGDEYYYSDMVSKNFNTYHNKYSINDNDLFENLDDVISCMSEPMVSQDSSAFYLLAKYVSQKQKVVLSGQGADELFGGYFWYKKIHDSKTHDLETFSNNYFDRNHDDFCNTITKKFQGENFSYLLMKDLLSNYNDSLDLLDKILRIDLSMLIVDDPVKRIDNMTMAWGLETRVPYLDIDLVEFVLKIPAKLKINDNGKYHLKKLSKKYLSEDIIKREKFYFPVPPLKIIQGKFYQYMKDILLSNQCRDRGLFETNNIKSLLDNPNKYYTKLEGNKLWHLTLLERWFQLNVDE